MFTFASAEEIMRVSKMVRFYCPNCGRILSGEKNSVGTVIVRCIYCGAIVQSRRKDRTNEIDMKVKLG